MASRSSSSSWGSAETSAIGPRSSLTTRPYRYAPAVNESTLRPARPPLHLRAPGRNGRPPVVEELMTEFGLTRAETTAVLRELADARHVALVSGTSRILMAFPFSAIATPFRVTRRRSRLLRQLRLGRGGVPRHARRDIPSTRSAITAPSRSGSRCAAARHARRAGRDASSTLRSKPTPMVGGHHHDLLQHDGLLLPRPSTVTRPIWPAHARFGRFPHTRSGSRRWACRCTSGSCRSTTRGPAVDELSAHFASLGLTGPYWQV